MFMTKMVSALPQPQPQPQLGAKLAAYSLLPAACCNLPPAMQIEKMPKSRCKWSCRCVSHAASAFACLPLPLCMPPLYSLSPSLSVQLGAVRQAASHQLNIVMRFTLTQPLLQLPLAHPPHPHALPIYNTYFSWHFTTC